MKQKFNVTGMTCSACSAHVEKAVRQVEGVDSVSVNLLGNSMLVEYGGKTGPEQIIQAVTDAGYGASLPGPAGAVGQQALALQAVPPAQRVRHGVHPGGLIPLACVGVDDPYMAHGAPSLMFVPAVSARTKTRRT